MKIVIARFLIICAFISYSIKGTDAWYFDLHLDGKENWFLNKASDYSGEESGRHSMIRFDYYHDFANKGFNNCGVHTGLSSTVFNNCFSLRDISLFVKLSDCNKVHRCPIVPGENPLDRCQRPEVAPNGIVSRFGSYRTDLYPTLLAPTNVCFNAEKYESEVGLTYLRWFDCEFKNVCYEGYFGFRLPVQSRLHILDYELLGGSLFTGIIGTGGALLENSLIEFYQDYISMDDLFVRGIIDPKDLCYKPRRRKTGFGDLSAIAMVYVRPSNQFVDFLELGINVVVPTGGKLASDYIWEPYLGNGGAFQTDLFANVLFNTRSCYWNPAFRASVQLSAPFTTCFRVPQCKNNQEEAQADTIDDLLVVGPSTYDNFWIMPYEQLDTTIPWFADEAVSTRIKWGTKWLVGMGNYFYETFSQCFRLGIFYDFIGKKEDSYEPRDCSKQFVPHVLTEYTDEQKHRLSWDLAYIHQDWCEILFGSKHIIAGRNVAQTHEFYAALNITF